MIAGVHDLWLFVVTVFVLNATPGVDMMITASRTLQHGLRGGLATALGVNVGCVVHTLAAAFGLAALLSASAAAFALVKWVGAAYLLWLAIGMLRGALRRGDAAALSVPGDTAPSGWALFRQGLLTNVLNPKIALFFLALLPQFIDAQAPDKTTAFLLLGAVMVVQSTLFLIGFVGLVSHLRRLPPRPVVRRAVQGTGGFVLLFLSARLALTQRP
ncbi:MAG: LysE family translocator [Pseudomonadota bacterium]